MPQGSFGRIPIWNDFTAVPPHTAADTVPLANGSLLGGGLSLIGVHEGTTIATVDEPGGVIAITTDTGDNDNAFIVGGTFAPADGGMMMEARIKIVDSVATTRAAAFVGFTETMAVGTPVMPFEMATGTQVYNGTGGMVGFAFDSDATSLIWRFVAGDGGTNLATVDSTGTVGNAAGIDAVATMTADRWWVFRVEVDTDGLARGLIGDAVANATQRLVGTSTAALGTSDNFHVAVGIENRSGANEILEVDYVAAKGWRDWSPD